MIPWSRTSGLQNCKEQTPISLSLWLLIVAAPGNFIQPLIISCHTSHKIQTPHHGPQVIWAQPANGRFSPRLSPAPPAWPCWPGCSGLAPMSPPQRRAFHDHGIYNTSLPITLFFFLAPTGHSNYIFPSQHPSSH